MSNLLRSNLEKSLIGCCVIAGTFIASPLKVLGSPFQSQGPFVIPEPGTTIPQPEEVPGKEFSDNLDRDVLGNLDSLQVISWDGAGGTADTFDYDNIEDFFPDIQVDALANLEDTLFLEVIADSSALLFSVEDNPNIYFETIKKAQGNIWADDLINIDNMNPITDVDGLEVWGLDGPFFDDSDRFSLNDDPFISGFGKTSAFAFDIDNNIFAPYILTAELANAIGVPEELFDLDAMMIFDIELDAEFEDGDWVMFSIEPIDLNGDGIITEDVNGVDIDGGEIFVYQKGGSASPLSHGGHLWDTAFDVSAAFNLNSENVNALESVSTASVPVPEPSSILSILALGTLGTASVLKRKWKTSSQSNFLVYSVDHTKQ